MLKEDIITAQKIVSCSFNNMNKENYHGNSFIYRFTNEKINEYQKYLENRKKVLTVTASGDQILNSVLAGTKEIDSYDISRFPRYFFELKKAAILSLSKKEYLQFFLEGGESKKEFSYELYEKVEENLKGDAYKFWDSLFQFFDEEEIYHSSLFSRETVLSESIKQMNPYLNGNNYEKLKSNLKEAHIEHHVGNIKELEVLKNKSYDLINLSSIIYYSFSKMDEYEAFLDQLNLNEGGVALTYLYKLRDNMISDSLLSKCDIDKFDNSNEAVMIYKRKS